MTQNIAFWNASPELAPEIATTETGSRPPRVDIAAITAARQAGPAPASPEPPDQEAALVAQVEGLRDHLSQRQAALQTAQDELAEAQRQFEAAQVARAQRQAALERYQQQAAQAAQASITAGHADVSPQEQKADEQIARLLRELARADAGLATLAARQAEPAQRVNAANQAVALARVELQKAEAALHVYQLNRRASVLLAELRQLVTAGRAHNRQVATLYQHWAQMRGGSLMDSQARASAAPMLFLPGAELAKLAQSRDTHTIAQQGFNLQYTGDLVSVEVDESQVLRW